MMWPEETVSLLAVLSEAVCEAAIVWQYNVQGAVVLSKRKLGALLIGIPN
jgi:hypothetical protein